MDANHEPGPGGARRRKALVLDDVRMRHHMCTPLQPRSDRAGGARGQRHELRGVPNEQVELRVVALGVPVVGVAQVVQSEDERRTEVVEGDERLLELGKRPPVETEVNVENIERVAVFPDPAGVQHQGRPPAAGHDGAIVGLDVAETLDTVIPIRIAQVPNVYVSGRHGRHADGGWGT